MRRTPVRLGRAVTGVLMSVVIVSGLESRAGAGSPQPAARSYVVKQGDTVWGIAARLAGPHADPRPMVDRLVRANALRDAMIVPGQRLTVP